VSLRATPDALVARAGPTHALGAAAMQRLAAFNGEMVPAMRRR
jgi:hypothetical protein